MTEPSNNRLMGKRVIVTGGASGIGRAIADEISREGGRVGILDWNSAALEKAVGELGGDAGRAFGVTCDVSDPSQPEAAINKLAADLGGLDGIVCAAGIPQKDETSINVPLDEWNKVIAINLTGAFLCGRAAARLLSDAGKGGSIVMIASSLAFVAKRELVSYVASKAGLIGVAKTMALELGGENIRCNSIAPGVVATALAADSGLDNSALAAWGLRTAMGRVGQPDDIAPVACFLLSDDSKWVTGQTISVDGGYVIR